MAIVGFLGFAYLTGFDRALVMAAQTPYNTIAMYAFAAVPMFVLMGALVSNTGIGADLYNSAYKCFGQFRGGLALATIVACAMFAAICGSSSAETLTIGKVALPEMKKFQYSDTLATGSIASGGTMGILIPPSIGIPALRIADRTIGGISLYGWHSAWCFIKLVIYFSDHHMDQD